MLSGIDQLLQEVTFTHRRASNFEIRENLECILRASVRMGVDTKANSSWERAANKSGEALNVKIRMSAMELL